MGLLKSSAVLGIEVSSSHIKLVEVDLSPRLPAVLNYAVLDLIPDDMNASVEKVKKVLVAKGFRAKDALIAFSGPSVDHRLIVIPPMSKTEMKTAVRREMKKESELPLEEISFDFSVVGKTEEKGFEKNEVLMVFTPRKKVDEIISMAFKLDLNPLLLTTMPLTFLNLFNYEKGYDKAKVHAFVQINRGSASTVNTIVTIISEGILRFSREFPLAIEAGSTGTETGRKPTPKLNVERLMTEINRSFLYFKQQHRGRQAEKLVLLGDGTNLTGLAKTLGDGLRVEAEVLKEFESLNLLALGFDKDDFQKRYVSLVIPLLLALNRSKKAEFNLIPTEILERKQILYKRILIAAAILILISSGIVGSNKFSKTLNIYHHITSDYKEALNRLKPRLAEINKTEAERGLHQEGLTFIKNLKDHNPQWSEFLKELSLIVPEEMIFEDLMIEKRGSVLQADLKGRVVAGDVAMAQNIFNKFYSNLYTSPFFHNISLEPIEIGPLEENIGRNKRQEVKATEENMNKLTFEIKFDLK